jgi:hypothetical protein
MNIVKTRLLQFVGYKEISNRKFAEKIAASPNILSTKSALGSDILVQIGIKYPELNMDWVINGRGQMLYREGNATGKTNEIDKTGEAEEPPVRILADDGEPYTKTTSINILPLFSKKPATVIKLTQDAFAALTRQLPLTNHLYLQVLLGQQAEADAARLGISIDEAKALIQAKVGQAGEGLRAVGDDK